MMMSAMFNLIGKGASRWSGITCSSSNGREPDSLDDGVKKVERLVEEKRRAELSARIASGEFTVDKPGYARIINNRRVLMVHAVRTLPQRARVSDGADGTSIPLKRFRNRRS